MRPPLYQNTDQTYRADTCRPLIEGAAAGRVRLETLVHGHYPGRPLPRGTLPGVKMLGYWDAALDQEWGLEWHHNEGIELTFLESGHLPFAVDRERFQLRANDLTVTRPWQAHRVGGPHVTAGRLHFLILDVNVRRPHQPWQWPRWLILTRADREELTGYLRQNENPVWPAMPEMAQCFRRIAEAVETDEGGSNVSALTIFLNELFLLLLNMFRLRPVALDRSLTGSQRTVELFWQSLQDDMDQLAAEWTVGRMARQCKLGTTRFTHVTKQLTNTTPGQYLNSCRLQAAERLLVRHPEETVTEVAMACGFSSPEYFARLFRAAFAVSPSTYRAEKLAPTD